MKAWFVYIIDGKKIGTWANNNEEAEQNLRKKYGDISMQYVGNTCHNIDLQPDDIIYTGMSTTDKMIAFGFMNMFIGLR